MGRVVLVTGASRYLGGRLADELARRGSVDRVLAVDSVPPRAGSPLADSPAEFLRADIRNPILTRIMDDHGVDTVVHMGVISTPRQAGGRSAMKDINVIGSMQLLAAIQRSSSVRTLIVKSTTSVYGAGPKDPALFTEDMEPEHPPTSGWAKDSAEVEAYVRGFVRRRPDISVGTARFANILGPGMVTGMTSYLSLPVIPMVLGFDARLQFVHEDDAIDSLIVMTCGEVAGTYNIAGDGVVMLSQAIRRMGKVALPIPALVMGAIRQVSGGSIDLTSEQVRFLTYGRAVDTTLARTKIPFVARYSTSETLDAYAHHQVAA